MSTPVILSVTDGRAGMAAQAAGLARGVAAQCGGRVVAAELSVSPFLKALPPMLAARFCLPEVQESPDIVIGCGVAAQPAVLAVKKHTGAFAVYIQRPRGSAAGGFDAVVAPRHDYSAAEIRLIEEKQTSPFQNVILTLGAVGPVDEKELAGRRERALARFAHIPKPRTAVLLGGVSRAFALSPARSAELAAEILAATAADGGGVLATASRRTGAENVRVFADAFAREDCFFYDGEGEDNPYMDMLAVADRFVVTCDSVNMLSEACAAACPVYVAELPCKSARAAQKFQAFIAFLQERGCVQAWRGEFESWQSPGLSETAYAAGEVIARWRARA